ncbi:MAG: NF038122 family metalloprotease [Cyanobacteria bacterium J06639_18]
MKLKAKKKLFHNYKNLVVASPLTFLAFIATCFPARAVSFNFSYQPDSITQKQIEGVELAGNIWSSYLQNSDVEVNVHFEMTNGFLPAGKLGGATPYMKKMNYDKLKLGLAADGTADVSLLPTSKQGSDKYSVMLQDGSIDDSYYEVLQTTANNKALGNDLSGDASGLDIYIQLESSVNWSFNYVDDNTPSDRYDFVSVVLHELGHGLGFVSGVDTQTTQLALPTTLDIFRYSSESASKGAIDYSVGGTKYFSTDGGETQIGEFATGVDTSLGGDGDQASHWKATSGNNNPACRAEYFSTNSRQIQTGDFLTGVDTNLGSYGEQVSQWGPNTKTNKGNKEADYLGIMSSTIQRGETRHISELDLTAFDYIGWDVNYDAQLNLYDLQQDAENKAKNIWGNDDYILDRSSDVESMIKESGIYEINYNFAGNSSRGFSFWQSQNQDDRTVTPNQKTNECNIPPEEEHKPATTPEPNIIAGLGIVGIFGFLRRRKTLQ